MKKLIHFLPLLALAFCLNNTARAQAPAGAPAGSTGQCKDGSYWTGATKSGACSGHKGVKTWWGAATAAAKPAPVAAPKPAPAAAPAPAPAPAAAAKTAPAAKYTAPANAAPGGGPGMVWVNTATKVYHCPGDRYYGKTKAGSYMTEAAAKSAGFKADANKPCTK
ncbi:MAG: DUF3761 domain-containing protein [Acidobacteriota bacterium]